MKKIFLIPGMGANKHMFKWINVDGFENECIEWIPPNASESLVHYAGRMSELIEGDDINLLGVSMGGMVASEIAKIRNVRQLILVSSAQNKNDLPKFYTSKYLTFLLDWIPFKKYRNNMKLMEYTFTVSNDEERQYLNELMSTYDYEFSKWAMRAIHHWRKTDFNKDAIYIHGDKDRIIPYKKHDNEFIIHGSGHLLVMSHHQELNQVLSQILN